MRDRLAVTIGALAACLTAMVGSPALAGTAERNVYYTYDSEGHQLTAKFDSVSGADGVANSYDGFGELLSTTDSLGTFSTTLSYLYDGDGNRSRLTFPDTNFFTYSYDGLDRENAILQGASTGLITIAYDQLGRRASLGRAGAGTTTYGYDNASRLQALTDRLASTTGPTTRL